MNIFKNLSGIFHAFIIASLFLNLSGCGYKAPPYYEQTPPDDANVKFIMEKKTFPDDSNASCNTK